MHSFEELQPEPINENRNVKASRKKSIFWTQWFVSIWKRTTHLCDLKRSLSKQYKIVMRSHEISGLNMLLESKQLQFVCWFACIWLKTPLPHQVPQKRFSSVL